MLHGPRQYRSVFWLHLIDKNNQACDIIDEGLLMLQSLQVHQAVCVLMQTERKEAIAAIGEDLFAVAVDQPFRFPAAFTFVLRAFATLEGLGKTLDPNFQFVTVAQPYAEELLELKVSSHCPVCKHVSFRDMYGQHSWWHGL